MKLVYDIEATGLLDHTAIDYSTYPLRLKESFRIHCIVFKDLDSGKVVSLHGESLTKERVVGILRKATTLIAHNQIGYDLLALYLYFGISYKVAANKDEQSLVAGSPCEIVDTVIMSRMLWPDRPGGHSLDAWGKRLGILKGEYGKKESAWSDFNQEMLTYCQQDVNVNEAVYHALVDEWGEWDWSKAFLMEQAIAEITVRQEHFGYGFNKKKAQEALEDLNQKMAEIESRVEPLLPEKPISKTHAKTFIPPKVQFKKNGDLSANMLKFIERMEGEVIKGEGQVKVKIKGKEYLLPMEQEPVVTTEPMTLANQSDLKQYLVRLGWNPVVWTESDLTVDSKKQRQSYEKYKASVLRYCEETQNSSFKRHRLEHRKVSSVRELYNDLMRADRNRPVRVLTSPKYTVDQDKTICPNLSKLGAKVEFVNDVVLWLTYRHRRNSILSPNGTGFLAQPRIDIDGRIQTPAITCGAATGRYKHSVCVNIPRPTSLYGGPLRELFGVPEGYYQIGCDAAGLEARVEAHYTKPYPGGNEYTVALLSEKPNDIHTATAKKMNVSRDEAKTLKYSCLPTDTTSVLTPEGWVSWDKVSVGDRVLGYDEEGDCTDWVTVEAIHFYENAYVVNKGHSQWKFESTLDHRWFGRTRRSPKNQPRYYENVFKKTEDFNTEFSILNTAPFCGGDSDITPSEAAVVAWLISDGYLKWSKKRDITSSSHGKKKGVEARISQSKNKYVEEIRMCLRKSDLSYKEYIEEKANGNHMHTFVLNPQEFRDFWERMGLPRKDKLDINYAPWLLKLSQESLKAFFIAFWQADGWDKQGRKVVSQNEGNGFESILLASYLCGYNPSVKEKVGGAKNFRHYTITASTNRYKGGQKFEEHSNRTTDVFCFTTSSGTFVARQGNTITITGNCGYGAQPPKIAKQMGWTLPHAKRVFEDFWEAASPLKILKERITLYWKQKGEGKFIPGIDGRKLMARSEHSLVNLLFQSCGVTIMKYAAIVLDRWMEENGYLFNPFEDSSFEGKACQMIHYHDEYQLQVCPSLVTIKIGDDAELTDFEMEGKRMSDITHIGDTCWKGYSVIGEMMSKSITLAAEYYNMRVPFDGDYQIGRNWKECH